MIKKLAKEGNRRYFKIEKKGVKILFSIWEFESDNLKDIPEIEKIFINSCLPSYLREEYTLECLIKQPLEIFELDIIRNELTPMNMSLWEYETFIKENSKAPKALKMAFINQCKDESTFYIACESFDPESMVTSKNMKIVNEYVFHHKQEIEEVINKSFTHVESY
ncbi:hypothetical protein BJV85_002851 [Clostridium acetobutylicum]|uniref:Uncharacterized protein n=1 Tax=Clostridium acetobutylicum (strain ATCC 824 / DSM 792 / JCM 1419 / IAM 19013 / LMG 5710 / NBRC 13948 / NRRL B-527 / VKM B-1787 / 2291 / W) TaxID=272562 RepID=Q97JX5_CLOAB|nr:MULTISPECIES: hypothetical protein [Clostridium]AAK79120.1 Hypothetical protein CA_C1148 [Clostridium acetobutylicum ATCC 824]ADZ20198.1 Conserved hypothetical protein [Clostridium acetobutylicum EA 2018]AEI31656.1 hypothetical protein SMB_G1168 [Clostridium acetobutylicum DSM 1731]AWV81626.1 hypothetical protein DK921_16315 [Clostridium acetobutylicum]MBC2393270.1 hypothetical protein [Clostridium acetobutylicum]